MNIAKELSNISSKNTALACASFDKLILESEKTDSVYGYWDVFNKMLLNKNAYVRMRALSLISVNAQWDVENKLEMSLPLYLEKLNDHKPIVVRICIKRLYEIIKVSPDSISKIKKALKDMDLTKYNESMINVISEDIAQLLSFMMNQET